MRKIVRRYGQDPGESGQVGHARAENPYAEIRIQASKLVCPNYFEPKVTP